jgi:DNA-binding transcriptional LysR family regulator
LEVTLLERTTRKLKLTQEGQQFLNHARKILSDLNAAEEVLQKSDQDTAGVIRVDSATPFILHVITPLVHKFRQCYPNIEIELNSNDLVIDLLEHKTDVAFRFGELNDRVYMPSWCVKPYIYCCKPRIFKSKRDAATTQTAI